MYSVIPATPQPPFQVLEAIVVLCHLPTNMGCLAQKKEKRKKLCSRTECFKYQII